MLGIKSQYILKKIVQNIEYNIFLNLIKYNKKLQQKLYMSIEDYKIYNQIEFEIKPNDNLEKRFINIKEEFDSFVHISLNDNKDYIKSFNINNSIPINKIKIIIDPEIKSLKEFFKNLDYIKEFKCTKFNRRDITDMSYMFYGCKDLIKLDISKFKTDNVTNMSYMFYFCKSLSYLDLHNFNTTKVTNMKNMFDQCSNLVNLNLNNFNTSNVIYMNDMFYNCKKLTDLNISNFSIDNAINMSYMFYQCSSLKKLDAFNFADSKVTDMSYMFYNCENIEKINLSKINTSNATNMSNMFSNCVKLKELYILNFVIKDDCRIKNMFYKCRNELKKEIKEKFKISDEIEISEEDDEKRFDTSSFHEPLDDISLEKIDDSEFYDE